MTMSRSNEDEISPAINSESARSRQDFEDTGVNDPHAIPIAATQPLPPSVTETAADGKVEDVTGDGETEEAAEPSATTRKRRKRRQRKEDTPEQRLQGRRALCKRIADIAPLMLKTVKLRALGRYLESTRGLDDADLTNRIIKDARKLADPKRILAHLHEIDLDADRRILKEIIVYAVLLQEETHSLDENRLAEKVIEYEKFVVKRAKELDFFDPKKHEPTRSHHYDTYRIVLDAAWRRQDDVSPDEAALLAVLRDRLNISREEHRLIGAHIKRFPKSGCSLHSRDEIHEARKELQRESILWSYRDENNQNIDAIPWEVVSVIRNEPPQLELQRTNFRRLLQHDSILLSDLRGLLTARDMDRYGNKAELIERLVDSDIQPSELLKELDRAKLSDMCRLVGLKSSAKKEELISKLLDFYDDLTFEERETQDEREEWYNNYELLAARAYSDLRAKKLISKDLDIEHQFEKATDFLFEEMLHVSIDNSRKVTKADGRILLGNKQVILWDCKCVEGAVNLQDHLEDQFDSYLRREREKENQPIAFLVIGPAFTTQSIKLAHQYKARTNWDIALVEAVALKQLADRWSTVEAKKPFPVGLFNRTELIDCDKAEFLLSLA